MRGRSYLPRRQLAQSFAQYCARRGSCGEAETAAVPIRALGRAALHVSGNFLAVAKLPNLLPTDLPTFLPAPRGRSAHGWNGAGGGGAAGSLLRAGGGSIFGR